MKKKRLVALIIFIVTIFVFYFSFLGIQTISTDKNIYSSGEEIKIHWSDLSLEWCTCSGKEIGIFKQETTGWKRIQYQLYGPVRGTCVNGTIASLPMHCDFVTCMFPIPKIVSGDFSWNSKIYENIGTVDFCFNPYNNETVNGTFNNYLLKNASAGKYKIVFGNSQEIIEIK